MPTPITLTETYIDAAGNPVGAGSRVLFLLTVPLTDSTTGARVPATTLTVPIDNQGRLLDPDTLQPGAILVATNDPTTLPTGAAYRVEERIAGQEPRIYYITVPYNAPSGTIALGLLVPGDTAPPISYALQSVQVPAPFIVTRQAGIDVVTYDLTGRSVGDVLTVLSLAPDVMGLAPPSGGGTTGDMHWRGDYDPAADYGTGDTVAWTPDGADLASTVVALQAVTGGDPSQDPNWAAYWGTVAYPLLPTVSDGVSIEVPNTQYITLHGGTVVDNGSGNLEYTPDPPPALSDADPTPLDTLAPGTSPDASRADHDHGLPTLGNLGAASAADLLTEANTARGAESALGGLISAEASTARGAESALTTALGGKASTSHAATHITGGSDIIPNAVAGGASGLLSGVLATRLGQFAPASGKTLTVSNSLTLAGTDGDTATVPSGGGTLVVGTDTRLTNARFPTSHTHNGDGSGALVAASIPDLSAVYLPVARLTGGGVLATAGFTLTVPATGTAALVGTDNVFSAAQGIRVAASGVAAGLHVPWVTGDALPAIMGGASTSGNAQTGVLGRSDSGVGLSGTSTSGQAVQGSTATGSGVLGIMTGAGSAALEARYTGSATNVQTGLILRNSTSGAGAAGTGNAINFLAKSSTANSRFQGQIISSWIVATEGSQTGRMVIGAMDSAVVLREGVRVDANGSAPMIGFLGHAAALQQSLAAAATDAATVITLANSIRTALLAYGLGV